MASINTTRHGRRLAAAAAVAAGALALAGCGGSSSGTTATASDGASPAAAGAGLDANVAYLSASSANTWLQTSKKEMEKVAAANGITITEFDAQFKAGEQGKQIQDVLASGKYKGIVISSVDGAGVIPDLQLALEKGLKVAVLNQVVGTKLDTPDPQFPGASVSVLAPPLRSGERFGNLTIKACEGISPCRVVYFYGLKGTPIDTALKQGFDAKIKSHPEIKVVGEAEGKYLGPDVALKALQDVMQRTPDFDVVVGPDQAIAGAELALKDAGKLAKVKLIGLGGSKNAIDGIKAGTWFGGVYGAPGTEGRLTMEALVAALRDGKVTGGIDPLTTLPDNGEVTKENVAKFAPEWNG
jgi:ribose transport system substrate-binding protein